jgi:hypothetical protein
MKPLSGSPDYLKAGGGMSEQALLPVIDLAGYVSVGASLSADRVYRYLLWREWESAPKRILWIMLNPSTADEMVLDPTLRRVEGFSRSWGFGGFLVCNLFALRSTQPAALKNHPRPIGERIDGFEVNDDEIRRQADRVNDIVCAWGSHKMVPARAVAIERLLSGHRLSHLGRNADGEPKHPLYLPASTTRYSWVAA